MSSGRGQHATEFVIVIGTVALAALGMQFLAQRAMRQGVGAVTDQVLGPDTPERVADRANEVSQFNARSSVFVRENGMSTLDILRRTTTNQRMQGNAINEDNIRVSP
jgi:hypothetical protein